jgi:hypothetical protein
MLVVADDPAAIVKPGPLVRQHVNSVAAP